LHWTIAGVVATALIGGAPVAAQTAEDAFGIWRHPDTGSHVSLYACGKRLCARIVKINDEQKTDDLNPDPAKRNRPIVGMVIMSAKKSGPNKWSGSLYDRADGKTYSGTITVSSRSILSLAGCSMGVFCKSTTWTRVER
jgi:uncharacterized protein (DUF2147 family)